MSTLKVNTVESATTPTVLISDGLSVSGVSTLSGGLKVGTAITMSDNGNFGITGIMTASTFVGGGMGKILQIVQANHNSALTNTDGNYQDTGLSASITTSSNHAGVLILANLAVGATANNGGDAYVKFNIVRDSSQVREGMCGAFEDNLSGHTHVKYWQPAMNFYDTGTSASTSYTYKCQFKKVSDAVNAFSNNANQAGSYILLVEVGT